jgi:hypothetical protein
MRHIVWALAATILVSGCGGARTGSGPTVDPALIANAAAAARLDAPAAPMIATPAPTPTPEPTHPYQVAFRAEQVIIPTEEVPLAGYVVSSERGLAPYGWERQFYSAGETEFWWLIFQVHIYTSASLAQEELARVTCSATFSSPLTSRDEIRADVVGDGAKACLYDFSDNTGDWVYYTTKTRNALVSVRIEARRTTHAALTAQAVALAGRQLAIIDRVSPP